MTPRRAVVAVRPPKRWPALTPLALRLLALALWLALCFATGVALARAEEPDMHASELVEEPRFTPASRSPREAVQELAEQHFAPEWVPWAVRTARCESSFDLHARSSGWDRRYGWYEHVGPWQVSVPTWAGKAWELFGGSLYDPHVSAAMAGWIVATYGPSHWPVCGR